jgi:hypothetical protein
MLAHGEDVEELQTFEKRSATAGAGQGVAQKGVNREGRAVLVTPSLRKIGAWEV